jgi:putative transposase
MPRPLRQIAKNQCYHVINRGNNQARVFHEHADYAQFVALMKEAHERTSVPVLAVCLMPNHFHMVVRPTSETELSEWSQWLFTTHARRNHLKYRTSGRLWQGRFKAFAIQEDSHLLTVMRYVERNALRAGLVARAEDWLWGSVRWRMMEQDQFPLAKPPVKLPSNWVEYVNDAQTPDELSALRACVNRQRPFGSRVWVEVKARELGLTQSLRCVGRPIQA